MAENLIKINNLKKYFTGGILHKTLVKAVDGLSFEIGQGEILGLVGESGCGKSTLGRCITLLLEPSEGEVIFNGQNLTAFKKVPKEIRRKLQIIFQDADGSLNPRMKVIDLLLEPYRIHHAGINKRQALEKAAELMMAVNLTPDLMGRYPGELSGGQRQRIGIGRAISLKPQFIVADEAAASLDLLVQSQMLDLLQQLQLERKTSCLYISHNLNVVRRVANRIAVMYLGCLIEIAETQDIFICPQHPYTRALIDAIPRIDFQRERKFTQLTGEIPSPLNLPPGCAFHPRCPNKLPICVEVKPRICHLGGGHEVACHLFN
nr:dipeptide ABC transporter ATP-binding protein [Dehalococcoides mccartyi]